MLVVDRTVKRLVEIQKERGRPAYFVFMSDNGMSWGQKGFTFKHVPTASRLPFYVKGPGIQKGQKMSGLVSNIDIAPTMAKMAGIGFGSADGRASCPASRGTRSRLVRNSSWSCRGRIRIAIKVGTR